MDCTSRDESNEPTDFFYFLKKNTNLFLKCNAQTCLLTPVIALAAHHVRAPASIHGALSSSCKNNVQNTAAIPPYVFICMPACRHDVFRNMRLR